MRGEMVMRQQAEVGAMQPRAGGLCKLEKVRNRVSPGASRRTSLANTWSLQPDRLSVCSSVWTSGLQNYKRVNCHYLNH